MNRQITTSHGQFDLQGEIKAAVILVYLNRRTMFNSGSGVTDVLFPE